MDRAIILGAGQGSRMEDYTNHLPKPFVEVGHNSILEWQLQSLEPVLDDVLLVLGYGFNDVQSPEEFVRNKITIPEKINLRIFVLDDWQKFENGGSCYYALQSEFVTEDENLLLICGDVLFKPDILGRFRKYLEESGENMLNYVFAIEGEQDEMTAVRWNDDGYITDYGAIEGHQEAGLFFLNSAHTSTAIEILSENMTNWFPIIFPKLKSKPFLIDPEKHAEINTPRHLREAEKTIVSNLISEISTT